ncbi:MAG TPA: hypothetical protein VG455_11115, partial [Acidimicrobiales bacterium]|nr:hypothetical protein [Acidimicrobiales bacterium]
SGGAPVAEVEISADGGRRWTAADVSGADLGPWAWRRWAFVWDPPATGEYELCCRARDTSGAAQPDAPPWNVGGYANNAVQRVPVTVVRTLP